MLAGAVAHTQGPDGFEVPVFSWLGAPSNDAAWAKVAELLATPVIAVVLVACAALCLVGRVFLRFAIFLAFGAGTLLANEYVFKPLVQRSYVGEPSFPSGNVTAVAATVLVVWLALFPILGRRARGALLLVGAAWVMVMAVAMVGAEWHTPLDDLGSLLLSIGIVAGGAAMYEQTAALRRHRRSDPRDQTEPQ